MSARPYGTWPSPIDAATVAGGAVRYAGLWADGAALYWLEGRPAEGGRSVLVRCAAGGGRAADLTGSDFDVRSRVYEYGGGAFCLGGRDVYFVNNSDQNIYAVPRRGGAARRVTAGTAQERFGDLAWDGQAIVAVREVASADAAEPKHDLVRVDAADGRLRTLHAGHDFYAAPRPSAHGRIAFLAWDHPNMPWDGTQLMLADYRRGALVDTTVVAGGVAESIVQPHWCGATLLFSSDLSGYWNLHAHDASGIRPVLAEEAEYGAPAWQLGAADYVAIGPGHVVARRVADGVESLVLVDLERGIATPLHECCASYAHLAASGQRIAFIAGDAHRPARVATLHLRERRFAAVAEAARRTAPVGAISSPEAIRFAGPRGEAHAFFYPPRNEGCEGLPGERPPLLVTTHGGPTSRATAELSWRTQFYTSRGWAVADVNYGGSSGYGRAYRERLRGAWGQVDVEDCAACVRHLAAAGRVDANRVAIRGASAGGYTTLAALAFTDAFKAGASHYGIGDLTALARDTHKFESRYVDALAGDADAIAARSPIHHVAKIDRPVIFLQGSEDKIVPPSQAESMRAALAAKGVGVQLLLFEGEGHGFRRADNLRRAIAAEHAFLSAAVGIATPTETRGQP